jgi:hypothetical protein
MRSARSFIQLIAALSLALVLEKTARAAEEGISLAIVYDTSGSMIEPVAAKGGGTAPKHVIANRALEAVVDKIQKFTRNSAGKPRKIETGLFVFRNGGGAEAVKYGAFDGQALKTFAKTFKDPTGNTPLGNALDAASKVVLKSPLSQKHVLIITDGMNTSGPKPEEVMSRLNKETQGTPVSFYFVAFDVNASVFAPVKQLGAMVVSAADEKQLNAQLEVILAEKILLEKE